MGQPTQDRYRILEPLGEGALGRVSLAEDRFRDDARVALKELAESSRGHEERLRREFATLASLRHPSLVEVHDFDLSPATGLPRFSMELIDGADIVAAVRRSRPALVPELAAEALRALAFLHDFGLLHRDLKPANLLVRRRARGGSRLVVLDFGLALQREGGDYIVGGGLAGTLAYLPPELIEGEPPSPRSDLYSLGTVLFEAVHGEPVFAYEEQDASALLENVLEGRRSRPSLPPGYPPELGGWLDELMETDPTRRPATAVEALARLNAACGTGFPIDTPESRRARLASGAPPGRAPQLQAIWEGLAPGDAPRVLWLCGDAGSGKTRTLRWLRSEAVLKGWAVESPPLETLRTMPEAEGRRWLTARLAEYRRSAADKPTLLLLDEVDSAEGAVSELLERIARQPKAPPLQVVAAVRPGEVRHPQVRRLLADTAVVPTLGRVDLPRLDASGVRALASRATASTEISKARVKWLLDASEGNALVATTLLIEGTWESGGSVGRQVALDEAVATRIRNLPAHQLALLEAVCVLGGETPAGIVRELADLARDDWETGTAALLDAGLVRKHARGEWSPESRVVAHHVVGAIGRARRREMNRRAAELLVEHDLGATSPWRMATHFAEAGDRDAALVHAERAAEQARRASDPSVAADRYGFALRQLGRRRLPERATLRMRQGDALADAGRDGEAVRAFGAALRLAPDPGVRSDAAVKRARALVRVGRLALAEAAARDAAALAERAGRGALAARAGKVLGMALDKQERRREAVAAFRGAIDALRASQDHEELAETLHFLGWIESSMGLPTASERFSEALEIARLHGHRRIEINTLITLATHCARTGQMQDAVELALRVRELAEEANDAFALRNVTYQLAVFHTEMGSYDRARALAQEAEDQALHLGDIDAASLARNTRADILVLSGRSAEAEAILRPLLSGEHFRLSPRRLDYARVTLAEALLAGRDADEEETHELVAAGIEGSKRSRNRSLTLSGLVVRLETCLRDGSTRDPSEVLAELDAMESSAFDELPHEYRVRHFLARAEHHRRNGREEAALSEIEEARGTAADHPALAARAHALAAEILQAQGNLEEAADRLRLGRRLLDEAAERIHDPEMRRDFLAREVFRRLREPAALTGESDDDRVMALYDMIQALNSEADSEKLLASILDMALQVVQAERGMILLLDPDTERFSVRLARNLERETAADAEQFSRGVVARAGAGEPVLAIDTGQDDRFSSLKSVSMFGIRSLMCVPLRSHGRIIGTVYVDSRQHGALFNRRDLQFIEAFADHAALALENARRRARLEEENVRLRAAVEQRVRFDNMIGKSPAMQRVFDLIEKVAASDLPVLIQGESGTGKELVANAVHFHSARRSRTFLSESCAAIPETLLESELFGHVRGAFTGAERDRPGLFEQADGGTLFLDEVGDMSPAMQARLLRVLQEGDLRRVGGERQIRVDVRVVAASHRDLQTEVELGRFREDLFYRLQVLVIQLPPLRERPGDVPLLVDHLLQKLSAHRGRKKPVVDSDVMALLERYSWPGNVRQLENVLQRLALLAGSGPITRAVVESDREFSHTLGSDAAPIEPVYSLEANERDRIRMALEAAEGNRNRAAGLLGISRATIYRKIREYDLR